MRRPRRECVEYPLGLELRENRRQIADIMKRMMQKNFDAHGHYYRGTHVSL